MHFTFALGSHNVLFLVLQMNCALLENCLHGAREEGQTHLCAVDRRASEYDTLRASAVKICGLFERLKSCVSSVEVAAFSDSLHTLAQSLARLVFFTLCFIFYYNGYVDRIQDCFIYVLRASSMCITLWIILPEFVSLLLLSLVNICKFSVLPVGAMMMIVLLSSVNAFRHLPIKLVFCQDNVQSSLNVLQKLKLQTPSLAKS